MKSMNSIVGSFTLGVLSLFLVALPSLAQQNPNVAPGFKAEGVYDFGGLDSVSLFSGGLSLTIPIGQTYSGKGGFSYQLTAQYSSSGWDSRREIVAMEGQNPGTPIRGPVLNPKYRNGAGFGWRVSLGELIAHDDFYSPQSENFSPLATNQWTYISQDGAEHTFYNTLHRGDDLISGVRYTRDGSYLRMTWVNGTPTEPFKVIIHFPNGSKQTFTRYQLPQDDPNPDQPYPHHAYRLERIHDASANVVKIS